ncbi:hypothetical protein [Pantoea phytobeneficialis]|uniref:Uncharacterized protein n=1 Tax=Pantoea phytobeneficialis TaxID=2052056 RepID=A0AAP9KQJ2_9GAMM|nr:hypothetical protein [Pantoea phytobeneficialis]MDO6410120.1 hypothetical protein [Pantoea phytobeneficialis]QGR07872.1 hypothetical protein CTZ24_16160 [Pantoea phytobeneficialis]
MLNLIFSEVIMIDVNEAIKKLVFILNKHSIAGMDSKTLPEDISDETRVKILSSYELHEFYSALKPNDIKIETGYSPIKIFSLDTIIAAQSGYQSLSDDSLVIADDFGGGKPIIAHIESANTPVYANYDVGKPFKIANDFPGFILCLAETIDVVYGSFNIFDIADYDDVIKGDFVNDLRFRVENIIGSSNFDAWFDYLYG